MRVAEQLVNDSVARLRAASRAAHRCLSPYGSTVDSVMEIVDVARTAQAFLGLYPKAPRPTPVARPESGPSPMTGVWGIYQDKVYPSRWYWTQGTMLEAWCDTAIPGDWKVNGVFVQCLTHQHCYATEAEAKLALHWDIWDRFVEKVKSL